MLERTALYAESWNVAWRKKPTGAILNDKDNVFSIIKNDFKYWAADPFLFDYNNETYIFAELYDYKLCRGCIGYCKWNGSSFGDWKKIITEEYHLSYPFIFEYNDNIFIMPESGADKSLYLYRAVDFPDIWEKYKVLRENVVYGDTTPFSYNNHHYALSYDVSTDNYKLMLLDFDDMSNDRSLDDINSTELRRPAGSVFEKEGKIFRPAQNCTNDYGEGILFYQVDFKSGNYNEIKIDDICPSQLNFSKQIILDGMHTYNSNNEFEIIDIKTRRLNLLNLIHRLICKIKR